MANKKRTVPKPYIEHRPIEGDNVLLDKAPCQANRVFKKFGSAHRLWKIMKAMGINYARTTLYQWAYPMGVNNGTGGLIPTRAIHDVLAAARFEGIILTSEDLDPRPVPIPANGLFDKHLARVEFRHITERRTTKRNHKHTEAMVRREPAKALKIKEEDVAKTKSLSNHQLENEQLEKEQFGKYVTNPYDNQTTDN